jgi:hypothetical protein
MDRDVVRGQQLVIQLRAGDLHREPALCHRGGEQRVRAVVADRIPARRMFAQAPVLPDRHDPGGDQMLHRIDGEYRVGLRVDAAVGHVHAAVAEQVLEQQAADRAECPFHGLLGPSRQLHPMSRVGGLFG